MELKAGLQEAADDIEDEISELQKFSEWIELAKQNWSQRSQEEQEGFRKSIRPTVERVQANPSTEELFDIYQELEVAYDQPVLDALRDEVREFSENLGVNLDNETLNKIDDRLADRFEDQVIEARRNYSEIRTEIENKDDMILDLLANYIRNNPFILLEPKEKIKKQLSKFAERKEIIETIDTFARKQEWYPNSITHLHKIEEYYSQNYDVDNILEYINEITIVIEETPEVGFQIDQLTTTKVEKRIKDRDPILDIFSTLHSNLKEISKYSDTICLVDRISDEVESKSSALKRVYSVLDNVRSESYSSLEEVQNDLLSLNSALDRWKNELRNNCEKKNTIIESYTNTFGFEPPDSIDETLGDEKSISSDPVDAYHKLTEAEEWISSREDDLKDKFENEESIDLIRDIINKDSVPYRDYSTNAVSEVDELIPLHIQINEE